jgi:hypothetical protein
MIRNQLLSMTLQILDLFFDPASAADRLTAGIVATTAPQL